MKIVGIVLTLCALTQAALALPEETLDLLCPAGADAKKASPLRAKLKAIEKGIDAVDKKGKSALILAAEEGNRLAVCYLVANGADVTLKDKTGKSAADYTRQAALRELLTHSKDTSDGPAVSHEQQEREALNKGLTTPEARTERLWKLAVTPRSLSEIAFLLSLGVELNAPGPGGKRLAEHPGLTPEYLAFLVRRGYNPAAAEPPVALRGDMAAPLVRLLLALGLQPSTAEPADALWAALFADDAKAVTKLTAANAELLRTRTEDGRPLLALAQSAAMVGALTKAGADASAEGLIGGIIDRYAVDPRSAEVFSALLKAGAPLPQDALLALCKTGRADARTLRALLSAGADANAADAEGNTALHLLLIHNAEPALLPDAVKALAKAGANTKAKNSSGKSPEALAKAMGREDILKSMKKAAAK